MALALDAGLRLEIAVPARLDRAVRVLAAPRARAVDATLAVLAARARVRSARTACARARRASTGAAPASTPARLRCAAAARDHRAAVRTAVAPRCAGTATIRAGDHRRALVRAVRMARALQTLGAARAAYAEVHRQLGLVVGAAAVLGRVHSAAAIDLIDRQDLAARDQRDQRRDPDLRNAPRPRHRRRANGAAQRRRQAADHRRPAYARARPIRSRKRRPQPK